MDPNKDTTPFVGNPCKACGHPAGAHVLMEEQDLDEPGREGGECSTDGCDCREYQE